MDVGLDRLAAASADLAPLRRRLEGGSVGLLAHPASVDRSLRHVADVLDAIGVKPVVIFGPEHGYGGEAQYMVGVPDAVDARSGAPIVSLYGDRFEDLSPRREHLDAIDVLLVDLADVGSRYYTFVWTALLAVRAAARAGVHVVVLDRPNPIGGEASRVEGRIVGAKFRSFVGLEPVPVRHSMTVGEIVATFAEKSGQSLGPDGDVSVVPVRGWSRASLAPAWDRPFVMTSPNMPGFETALVYPGGCLLEGTNLSEGRGTTRPFEVLGAPFVDGPRLARDLASLELPGFTARPLTFQPTFHKFAMQVCGGVQIHVTDPNAFRPFATYVALVALAARQSSAFAFRTEPYEYVDDIPAFDLLTGSAEAREAILRGDDPREIAEAASKVDGGWADAIAAGQAAVARAAWG
jgi:uncharacterized protein YbbC (DUF1343 family)